jgi:RimJ/RimL family protein N-acetyltransferase
LRPCSFSCSEALEHEHEHEHEHGAQRRIAPSQLARGSAEELDSGLHERRLLSHVAVQEEPVKNAYLIGKRIYLRPLEKEDASLLASWFNDPEITRNLDRYHPMSVQSEEAWIAKAYESKEDLVLGIARKEDHRLLGSAGLHRVSAKNRSATFGIAIGEKTEWGKGYGTEATWLMTKHAFETLNLNRVELHVREFNERGIRAYERVGYRREGLLREHAFVEGRYVNTIAMAILRAEWDARQSDAL